MLAECRDTVARDRFELERQLDHKCFGIAVVVQLKAETFTEIARRDAGGIEALYEFECASRILGRDVGASGNGRQVVAKIRVWIETSDDVLRRATYRGTSVRRRELPFEVFPEPGTTGGNAADRVAVDAAQWPLDDLEPGVGVRFARDRSVEFAQTQWQVRRIRS